MTDRHCKVIGPGGWRPWVLAGDLPGERPAQLLPMRPRIATEETTP